MTAMDINKVKNETENFIQLHIKFSKNRSFFFPHLLSNDICLKKVITWDWWGSRDQMSWQIPLLQWQSKRQSF